MTRGDLGGPLLKSVSRSFYLSVRVLPAALRAPVGLGYLLARASDTIADSADLPGGERETHLGNLARMIEGGGREGLAEIKDKVRPEHAGEAVLIAQLDRCLEWLEAVPEFDRTEIHTVLREIIHGQTLDVQRFADRASLTALETGAELEEYTYLVAGCVGEFWTRVSAHYLSGYSKLPLPDLLEHGKSFGKALQLVNVLRDLPADLKEGRCYLPAEEVDAARLIDEPASGRACFAKWLARAETLLDSGRIYIRSIRPARVRMGCYLPWSIARKTLALLHTHPPLETPQRVKVSRAEVRKSFASAVLAAVSDSPLR